MIEKIREYVPLEKLCEYMPFGWTLHAKEVRKGTNPVCYYSFSKEHSCYYLQPRRSKFARALVRCNIPFRLYDCTKKRCLNEPKGQA